MLTIDAQVHAYLRNHPGHLSDAVTDNALRLGLSANIVRAGASEGVMRIAPPLTATEAEIDLGLVPRQPSTEG
jgi:4-aminobutyrate aminotransferase-like enzyme